jgi:hypothetical protein
VLRNERAGRHEQKSVNKNKSQALKPRELMRIILTGGMGAIHERQQRPEKIQLIGQEVLTRRLKTDRQENLFDI